MTDIDTQKPPLTARQLRAIAALCEEPTTRAAARKARVGEKTLWRWLNDPAFAAAYQRARSRLLEDTLVALQAAGIEAIETLREVMAAKSGPASARVSAARCVLEMALRGREIIEVEERLRALEDTFIGRVS
jgi:hypothetical protein